MIRGIIALLLLTLSTSAYAAIDHYKYSPYTSNLDNVGSLNVADSLSTCLSDLYCFVYEGSMLKLYVNTVLQVQWPIAGPSVTDILLLETGDAILLENGTDRILL